MNARKKRIFKICLASVVGVVVVGYLMMLLFAVYVVKPIFETQRTLISSPSEKLNLIPQQSKTEPPESSNSIAIANSSSPKSMETHQEVSEDKDRIFMRNLALMNDLPIAAIDFCRLNCDEVSRSAEFIFLGRGEKEADLRENGQPSFEIAKAIFRAVMPNPMAKILISIANLSENPYSPMVQLETLRLADELQEVLSKAQNDKEKHKATLLTTMQFAKAIASVKQRCFSDRDFNWNMECTEFNTKWEQVRSMCDD